MGVNRDDVAVWALDALDPEEGAVVERELAAGPELAPGAARLRAVVGRLGELVAATPPADLRAAVLDAARAARPPLVPATVTAGVDPLTLYERQAGRLAALAAELDTVAWRHRAAPYPWDAQGLVAHLLAVERVTAAALRGTPHQVPLADHLAMSEHAVGEHAGVDPRETVAAWRDAAAAVVDAARHADLEAQVVFHGLPMRASTLLVVRAFELWTHADDIRRATGRAPFDPPAEEIRTMADRSASSLAGLALLVDGPAVAGRARLVLTGAGGGAWDVDLGGDPTRRATVVADAVDWCRLVARRLDPAELAWTVRGDAAVADRLVAAARSLAL